MSTQTSLDKAGANFVSQFRDRQEPSLSGRRRRLNPAITIAHQSGAGAPEIAGQLARSLQKINTDRLSNEDAVALISEGAQRFFSGL